MCVIEGGAGTLRARIIATGPRLYLMQAVGPGDSSSQSDPEAARFFDSLRLK